MIRRMGSACFVMATMILLTWCTAKALRACQGGCVQTWYHGFCKSTSGAPLNVCWEFQEFEQAFSPPAYASTADPSNWYYQEPDVGNWYKKNCISGCDKTCEAVSECPQKVTIGECGSEWDEKLLARCLEPGPH